MTTTLQARHVALKLCLISIVAAPACAANTVPQTAENARATIQKLTGDWSYAAGVIMATNAFVTSNACDYYFNGAKMPSDGEQTLIGCGVFIAYADNSWDWLLPGLYEDSGGLWLVRPFLMDSEDGLGVLRPIGDPTQAVAGHTYGFVSGREQVLGGFWQLTELGFDVTANSGLFTVGNYWSLNSQTKAVSWTAATYDSHTLAPLSQYDEATAQFDEGSGYLVSVTTDDDPNGPQQVTGVQTLVSEYGLQDWIHNQPSGPGWSVFWDVPSATVNVNNLALK